MTSRQSQRAWGGVIFAGGDGIRLQGLTTRIEGDTRPKEFCRMLGDQSLLTQTQRRIRAIFDADKIVTVVTRKHEAYYSKEFDDGPPAAVIVQPENRGTGVAVATALLMRRDLMSKKLSQFPLRPSLS